MTWPRSFFNLSSPARNAATRRRKPCRPTPANGSTSARTARRCCVPRQATAACSAPTGRISVRRSRRMARHAARAERRTGCLRQRMPPSSRHSANTISGAERGVMPRRRRMAPGFFVMSKPSNRMRPLLGLASVAISSGPCRPPYSRLSSAPAFGRDFLFMVNADSSHSARRGLSGRSSRRRAQRLHPGGPHCPELVAAKQSLELVTTGIGAASANIDEKHHRHPISASPDLRADCVNWRY